MSAARVALLIKKTVTNAWLGFNYLVLPRRVAKTLLNGVALFFGELKSRSVLTGFLAPYILIVIKIHRLKLLFLQN